MGSDVFKTKDFRLAGFLVSRGVELLGFDQETQGTDIVFSFKDDEQASGDVLSASRVAVLYPLSAEMRYDSACRVMHDLVKSRKRR